MHSEDEDDRFNDSFEMYGVGMVTSKFVHKLKMRDLDNKIIEVPYNNGEETINQLKERYV